MMLRCECGGALELQNSPPADADVWVEHYECVECGQNGSYSFNGHIDRHHTTGCVTEGET